MWTAIKNLLSIFPSIVSLLKDLAKSWQEYKRKRDRIKQDKALDKAVKEKNTKDLAKEIGKKL